MGHLFIISPVFNEAENISPLVSAIEECARNGLKPQGHSCTIVLVDDGSQDASYTNMTAAAEKSSVPVIGLRLSRNFGQQSAIQAGLEYAFEKAPIGSWFCVLDSDLQHPPGLIPKMVEELEQGADHVQMVRNDAHTHRWFKKITSQVFYWFFRSQTGIPLKGGSSDFRGMSYPFVKAYLRLSERGRFNRGLFHWVGFEKREIAYEPADRKNGYSKYSFRKMLTLALVGISQFSSRPLTLALGLITFIGIASCTGYILFETYRYFHGRQFVLGWSSLFFVISFWGGALALGQLLIAVYVSRLFDEVKARPLYIVRETTEKK